MSHDDPVIGRCWQCGAELRRVDLGRETHCLGCGRPTRVCRNCRWYDPARANQCQEPVAEPVADKARANFCDFFEPSTAGGGSGEEDADALRRSAEELFKF